MSASREKLQGVVSFASFWVMTSSGELSIPLMLNREEFTDRQVSDYYRELVDDHDRTDRVCEVTLSLADHLIAEAATDPAEFSDVIGTVMAPQAYVILIAYANGREWGPVAGITADELRNNQNALDVAAFDAHTQTSTGDRVLIVPLHLDLDSVRSTFATPEFVLR